MSKNEETQLFELNPTGVQEGTGSVITVDVSGRALAVDNLTVNQIPNLTWNKITRNIPTTLEGYGIIDGVKKSGDLISGGLISTVTATDDFHAVTKDYTDENVGGDGIPTGTIMTTASQETPDGYLRLNGASVNKGLYADLFTGIGNKYLPNVSLEGNGVP